MLPIIAVIDAELAEGKKRRFPNLSCMKISGYHKSKGNEVTLKTDYKDLQDFEKIYISKVFTKTICDDSVLCLPNVQYGGTGFFNENAPGLLYEFEHAFPDYALYNGYVSAQIEKGTKPSALKCFVDYSTELSLDIV